MSLLLTLAMLAACPVESIRVVPDALPYRPENMYVVTSPIESPIGQAYGMFVSPDGSVIAWIPYLDPAEMTWDTFQYPRGWWLAVEGYDEEFFADEDVYHFSRDFSTVVSRRYDGALIIRRLVPPTLAEIADHDGNGLVDMVDFAALQRGEFDLDNFPGTTRMDAELFALIAVEG